MYGTDEIMRYVFMMCAENASHEGISQICKDEIDLARVPTGATLLNRVGGSSYSDTHESCDRMIDVTLEEPRNRGLFRKPVITATDDHDVPVHFEKVDDEYMTAGKPKGGTSKMLRYTTVQIVGRSTSFILAVHPTGKNHAKEAIVGTQIRQIRDAGVVSKTHLLDKGFYKVEVIKILDAERRQYVMPARWSKKIDDIVGRI